MKEQILAKFQKLYPKCASVYQIPNEMFAALVACMTEGDEKDREAMISSLDLTPEEIDYIDNCIIDSDDEVHE